MARSRNIKPSIMDNENLAELEPLTRLLFIYLWMLADRSGRLEDRPKRIAAQALPYDRLADVNSMLDQLCAAGFIERYEADGVACIQIVNFTKHQTPHVREQDSVIPSKNKDLEEEKHCLGNDRASPKHDQGSDKPDAKHCLGNDKASPRSPDSLIPDSLIPNIPLTPRSGGEFPGFAEFWAAWPKSDRKQAKGECLKAWKKAGAERHAAHVVGHVRQMAASDSWRKDGGQYIPAPLVYLRQRRWEGAEGLQQLSDSMESWWLRAGFANEWEAQSAGCYASNAAEFADGKRREVAA